MVVLWHYIKDLNINMNKFILPFLSKTINRFLQLDPESANRLEKLADKAVKVELAPFDVTFICRFTKEGAILTADDLTETQTTIRGTPSALFNVVIDKTNRQRFFKEDVLITGDAELGQDVMQLFDSLEIDWEDYLANFIGDSPASLTGMVFRGMKKWIKQTDKNMSDNVNEYLHEEANWLPARAALNDLFQEIDETRLDADRLEARFNTIVNKSKNKDSA